MRRNFNVKIFIVTFMIVLAFFAAVEIVFLLYARTPGY